jgi:hypothetical protein
LSFLKPYNYFFLFKVFKRQIQPTRTKETNPKQQAEKFQKPDKDQSPSDRSSTYLLTMLPVAKGDHLFNSGGEQEWEIMRDTNVQFAIYGV